MWLAMQSVAEHELTGGGVDVNVACYAVCCQARAHRWWSGCQCGLLSRWLLRMSLQVVEWMSMWLAK